jgi:alcohol dehydrogenase
VKSILYHGPFDVRVEEIPDAVVEHEDQAVVRIDASGLCGSDLHPYHVDLGLGRGYGLGHEAVGEVVATGPGVSRFRPGDRVFVPGSLSCGTCGACRRSLSMQCENHPVPRVFGQGFHGIGGCQAEAVVVPDADLNLYAMPDDMPDELGVMLTDNLPTAWMCARKGRIREGSRVAVIGLGPVGLQTGLAAAAMRASHVFALDLVEHRREEAAKLGMEPVGGEGAAHYIDEATNGMGVDAVLDTVGSQATFDLALQVVRKGGVISVVGVPEEPAVSFSPLLAVFKSVDLCLASCSVQAEIPAVLGALERGLLDPEAITSLVTHRMSLSQGAEAYALFDARADGANKVLLLPGR